MGEPHSMEDSPPSYDSLFPAPTSDETFSLFWSNEERSSSRPEQAPPSIEQSTDTEGRHRGERARREAERAHDWSRGPPLNEKSEGLQENETSRPPSPIEREPEPYSEKNPTPSESSRWAEQSREPSRPQPSSSRAPTSSKSRLRPSQLFRKSPTANATPYAWSYTAGSLADIDCPTTMYRGPAPVDEDDARK